VGGKQPRIQHTILTWMIVLTIVPIALVSFQGYHCARQALVETQDVHLQAILHSKNNQIERILDVVRSDLHLLSILTFSNVQEPEKGCCQSPSCTCNPLSKALGEKDYYANLIAFDSNWQVIGSARSLPSPVHLPETFKKSLETTAGLVFSNLMETENGPEILTGCPLTGQQTGSRGFITGALNLGPIVKPILSNLTGIGSTGRVILVSNSGKMILFENGNLHLREPNQMIQALLKTLPEETSTPQVLTFPDTGKILVSSMKISTLNWRMFLITSYSDTFKWLNILRNRAILTGIVVFILVLFVATKMAASISRPLKILSGTANSIASGQIAKRVPPLPGREAADVANAFNRMMNSLNTLQQELAHSASLAAIGQLSSSIVHEMRNPLSSVKMNLQALREKVKNDTDYLELSEIALSQAARLENMLTELLGYGKAMELHRLPFSLHEFVKSCVTEANALATEKHVKIRTEIPSSETTISGDRELLYRAVVNLLRNAVEATPQGKAVTISVQTEAGSLAFTVADEGPGIPAGILEEIFKPFITSKENGTGLGLANVRKVTRLHGGTVTAENMETGGARFVIRIPQEEHQI
jgi:signal transduction histidine kinase